MKSKATDKDIMHKVKEKMSLCAMAVVSMIRPDIKTTQQDVQKATEKPSYSKFEAVDSFIRATEGKAARNKAHI